MSVSRHRAVKDVRTAPEVTDACVTMAFLWTPAQENAQVTLLFESCNAWNERFLSHRMML